MMVTRTRAEKYVKKIDRLLQTNKPTCSAEMILGVKEAKEIKDILSFHEVIGYASHNSDDDSDGLIGAKLSNKDGAMNEIEK